MTGRKGSRASARSKVEWVSIFGARAHVSPIALHHYAAEFLRAAMSLGTTAVPFSPVQCFLACRPIELALKAYLNVQGVPLETLGSKRYGHNIGVLLEMATQRGLLSVVPLTTAHTEEINRAASYYSSKVFEYPSVIEALHGYPERPDTGLLLEAAQLLVKDLHDSCVNL